MTVKRSGNMAGLQAKVENGATEGLILAGDLIAQRAQDKVHVVTGRLKRSLKRGNPYRTSKGMAIAVGSNVEYAREEEERPGTKDGTPHAYLTPAVQESRETAIRLVAARIVAKLRKQ